MKTRRKMVFATMVFVCVQIYAHGQVVYVDAAATGANTGGDWVNAYRSLQTAIAATTAPTQIWVAAGTYVPGVDRTQSFVLKDSLQIYGGFSSGMTSLTQRVWQAHPTVLSGEIQNDSNPSNNTYHVIKGAADTVLDGLIITGGRADSTDVDARGGGLLYDGISGGTMTVRRCLFLGNSAVFGGAVSHAGGGLEFDQVHFTQNIAFENGGAIFTTGDRPHLNSRLFVFACIFRQNRAAGDGGAVYGKSVQNYNLRTSTFIANSAGKSGGALSNTGLWFTADRIEHCVFVGNSAQVTGGAIDHNNSNMRIVACDFIDNQAVRGGAYSTHNAKLPLTKDCRFFGNVATSVGGAIYGAWKGIAGVNCLFASNVAEGADGGGALYQYAGGDPSVMTNCIYTGNRAPVGGAVATYSGQTVTHVNCVMWGNGTDASDSGFHGNTNVFINATVSGGRLASHGLAPTFKTVEKSLSVRSFAYDPEIGKSILICKSVDWKPGSLAGMALRSSFPHHRRVLIVTNTATSLVVWGNVSELELGGEGLYVEDYNWKAEGWPVGSYHVKLEIDPVARNWFGDSFSVKFRYGMPVDLPADGTARVAMVNVDTGQSLEQTIPIKLSQGSYTGAATWGAAGEAGLPDGLYLPEVTLLDSEGNEIGHYATPSEQVQQMLLQGKAAQYISKASAEVMVAEMKAWGTKIDALEKQASAAGANVVEPAFFGKALRWINQESKAHMQMRWYDVVAENHAYAKAEMPQVRAELDRLTVHPESSPARFEIPHPEGRFERKDGYWFADGRPVWQSGPALFNFTVDQLPAIRDFGYNIIHVSTGVDCVFPDSEEPTGALRIQDYGPKIKTGNLLELLDNCQKLGLKVDLGLSMHFLPPWFLQKYPDARNRSPNFMLPYDIEHPEALKLIERYFDHVMPQLAGHPAINCIWLANEPGIANYSAKSIAVYRETLQKKYTTVATLNEAWGTQHASFDAVTPSASDFAKMGPATVEWWNFNLDRLTHHFDWLVSLVRQYDKDVPTAFKLNNIMMNPQFRTFPNVNQEDVTDLTELLGMDSGTYSFAKPYYDWLRSLSPEKPLQNLEWKGFSPPERTRLDFWKSAIFGMAGVDWWAWHPKYTFTRGISHVQSLHQAALATHHIQRLLPQIMAFQQFPRSPFVVVYPDPVHKRSNDYFDVHEPTVFALKMLGYAVDYATEKRIAKGRLDQYAYNIVVMPAANYICDETLARVEAFVRKGGTVVFIGALPLNDETGKPRAADWVGGPVETMTVAAYANGTIWKVPAASQADLEVALQMIADRELAPQPVVIRGAENRTLSWRNAEGKDVYLTYVLNEDFRDAFAVEIKTQNPKLRGIDLITGRPVKPGRNVLPPASMLLIEWTW